MAGGRPLKFKTDKELKKRCDAYFNSCWKMVIGEGGKKEKVQVKPYLITGLALHLGTTRQTLVNYEVRAEFLDTIKEAKLKCESYAEEVALVGKNQAGAIFALKNYGWKDSKQVEFNDVTERTEEELELRLAELLGEK